MSAASAATHAGHDHGHEALAPIEPTNTLTIRRQYARALRGVLRALRAITREAIVERDIFGIKDRDLATPITDLAGNADAFQANGPSEPQPPRGFRFATRADQVDAWKEWLQGELDANLLTALGAENEFIIAAYRVGLDEARSQIRRAGIADPASEVMVVMQQPVHRDQLQAMFTRNFAELEGMTTQLATDTARELTDGLAAGEGPRTIAGRLADVYGRMDDGSPMGAMARATRTARTEILNSHHRAELTEWTRFGVQRVGILLSPSACNICKALKAGEPYTTQEMFGLLPAHPNCRCAPNIWTGS